MILLADDDDSMRRSLARHLRASGHTIIEAFDGRHALELLAEHDVDILLSDITMPDVDGLELLRQARERKPDVPVLLMTGLPAISTAMQAVQYGACDYLTKPLDFDKLEKGLARALDIHRRAVVQRNALASMARVRAANGGHRVDPSLLITAGTMLGDRYRIVRPLGAGGMGSVYAATREDLGRMQVAVKVLLPELASRSDSVRRFRREAEIVAGLRHPNIVNLLDFVTSDDGATFLVMELLNGCTLSQAIEHDPPFSESRVAFIASQLLSALEAAHVSGIVHRDLKPDNVFLTRISGLDDVVKVLDFGVAKLLSEPLAPKLTQTGVLVGTPAYMAPEYARGEEAGISADVYGVGCAMYEMITKKQPFAGANYHALLHAIQEGRPEAISAVRTDFSPDLTKIVTKAMAIEPRDRFESARAMADALEPWVKRQKPTIGESRPPIESAPTELLQMQKKTH